MKSPRVWLVVALALVLGGAFVVSASSTWRLGTHHHLADLALPALVLMLEVGSVTGAAIYVATKRNDMRIRAGLVVGIATGVGATGGVQAYGFLIGLPVAALLLLLVDLIGQHWHEVAAVSTTSSSDDQPAATPEPVVAAAVDEPVDVVEHDDGIDWSLSERRLATELGITRHAARQLKAARTEVAS